MFAPTLRPYHLLAGIGLLAVLADGMRRVVPFYRRELNVESATRLTPLDGLRGILCFAVMYHHAAITQGFVTTGEWAPPPAAFIVLLGQTSVALFFCVTAFLFWSRAIAKQGNIPALAFWRGRCFRIVPLYVFTCVAALLIAGKHVHWSRAGTHWGLARMALMGLNGWGVLSDFDIRLINCGVVWTLQFEWIFYLALPALAPAARNGGGWRVIGIFLALKSILGWTIPPDLTAFFLSGIIAAELAARPRIAQALRRYEVAFAVIAIGLAMPFMTGTGYGWLPLLLTTLIFIPIACGNTLLGLLGLPGLRMLGVISYSVYLLHGMFLYLCRPWLRQATSHGVLAYWLAIFAVSVAVLMFCSITYRFVEWPFMQLEKKFRRPGELSRVNG